MRTVPEQRGVPQEPQKFSGMHPDMFQAGGTHALVLRSAERRSGVEDVRAEQEEWRSELEKGGEALRSRE